MVFTKIMAIGLIAFLLSCAGARPKVGGQLHFVTIEEELRLGEEIASHSIQHLPILRNRSIHYFLSDLARRIGQVSDWQGLQYTIFVVNAPDVNHFSLPGGNIYLFRGLLELCSTPQEAAAVIAHEIAHLSARDGVERLAAKYGYSLAAQQIIGDNPEIAEHIIRSLYKPDTILDYSSAQEFAADQRAVVYLLNAGLPTDGLASLLRKIQTLQQKASPTADLLSVTHPSAKARLAKLKPIVKSPSASAAPFDPAAFQKMQELLSRLPR